MDIVRGPCADPRDDQDGPSVAGRQLRRPCAPPDKAAFDREADAVQAALDEAAARFGVELDKPDAPARSAGPLR